MENLRVFNGSGEFNREPKRQTCQFVWQLITHLL